MSWKCGRWLMGVGALVLVVRAIASAGGGEEPESPVTGLARGLDELERQGKDVKAFRKELEALKPESRTVEAARRELDKRVEAFRPKFEALMGKVHAAFGPPPGETPIVGLRKIMEAIRVRGVDVSALQAELDRLAPEWEAFMKLHRETPGVSLEERGKRVAEAAAKLRPKLDSLAVRVHDEARRVLPPPPLGG